MKGEKKGARPVCARRWTFLIGLRIWEGVTPLYVFEGKQTCTQLKRL